MDDSTAPSNPLTAWFQSLPESQRRLVPVVVIAALAAGGWLATRGPSTSNTPIALPHGLTAAAAAAHLNERGIADASPAPGNKLTVPAARAADAKRFLDEYAAVTTTWADEWEKSNSQLGQFSGHRERDAAKEIARARMIGRLLRQMPGVAQADVVWDEDEASGWRSPQKTRCTVYLRPKTGCEITPDVARSVRQAVAGSKKNLAAEDIVVMDLDRMTTFDAVPTGIDDATRTVAEREVADLRRQIESELIDCPGVRVNVALTWRESEAAIPVTTASHRTRAKTTLVGSNGFLRALEESDRSAADGQLEPQVQVTITAPEDAATRWAAKSEARKANEENQGVVRAGFQKPAKGAAADCIRQSVCSLLSRVDHRKLATGVAVHLLPVTGAPPALIPPPEKPTLDPMWFIALSVAGCFGGAWILSSLFSSPVSEIAAADQQLPFESHESFEPDRSIANQNAAISNAHDSSPPADFEDLVDCPADTWRRVFEITPLSDCVTALKGATMQLRCAVLASLDPDAAATLERALATTPALRLGDMNLAQRKILDAAMNAWREI